jgi:hypothetical protein
MQAGDFRAGEHLRETAFGGSGFEWNAVQQELRATGAQQQAALAAGRQGGVQLFANDIELCGATGVLHPIQAGELQQHVEAADKGAGGRRFGVCCHRCEPRLSGPCVWARLAPNRARNNGARGPL